MRAARTSRSNLRRAATWPNGWPRSPWPRARLPSWSRLWRAAMHAAHEAEVVHRDLKPSNVLFTGNGIPKVGDFGLAKLMDSDSGATLSGEPIGTPSYMAPEQAAGKGKLAGPAADIYSLGAILYHTLTGRPPFLGASALETIKLVETADVVAPRLIRPDVPRDLETICLKCLEKETHKRYGNAIELADDLRCFLERRPILARAIGPAGRLARWSRRNPLLASLYAAGLLGLILATAIISVLYIRAVHAEKATQRERDQAETEAANAKAINEFLRNDLLAQSSCIPPSRPRASCRSRSQGENSPRSGGRTHRRALRRPADRRSGAPPNDWRSAPRAGHVPASDSASRVRDRIASPLSRSNSARYAQRHDFAGESLFGRRQIRGCRAALGRCFFGT